MPKRLSQPEFVALLAMLSATVALSIDAMLPGLPAIAKALSPLDPNRAQLVLTSFVFGMGVGTLCAGPLADRFGRKAVIVAGLTLYAVAAIVAALAQSLDILLAARVVQGLGVAGPRVASLALLRDTYKGRAMARISSFIMLVFILVPAIAPAMGAQIIHAFGWRGVFGAFVVFAIVMSTWLGLRQEETLPEDKRVPLEGRQIWIGLKDIFGRRNVVLYILVITLGFGQLFGMLSSIQQIYSDIFDKWASFPYWFALGAVLSGAGTLLNARYVTRLGMRRIAILAYISQVVFSAIYGLAVWSGIIPESAEFICFFAWSVSLFTMAGLTFGNLIALALEPLGHIAGLASSVVQGVSTVLAVAVAAPIGLAFNGTVLPLLIGTFICSAVALLILRSTLETDPVLA